MDKLRALRCFCRVAEAKSFAAAAQELHLVPSVVSKSISSLEAMLGYRLFNRTTRRVHLTEPGAAYYEVARRVIGELDEAEQDARDGAAKPAGRLLVGLHPSVSRLVMSNVGSFLKQYPKLFLETTLTSTQSTIMEDRLDVLITVGKLTDATLGVRKLGTTRHVLVASPDYLSRNGRPNAPDELRDHLFIVSGRPDAPSFARWTMKRGNKSESVMIPARALNRQGVHMHEACIAGAGIVRLVEIAARPYLRSGELVPVLPEWSFGELPVSALYPSHRNLPGKVRAFVQFAGELIKKHPAA